MTGRSKPRKACASEFIPGAIRLMEQKPGTDTGFH